MRLGRASCRQSQLFSRLQFNLARQAGPPTSHQENQVMNNALAQTSYTVSLEEVFWGGLLVAITMTLHGCGMLLILRVNNALKLRFDPNSGLRSGLSIIILASW